MAAGESEDAGICVCDDHSITVRGNVKAWQNLPEPIIDGIYRAYGVKNKNKTLFILLFEIAIA